MRSEMKKIGVSSAFMHPSHERNNLGKKRLCFYSNDMGIYLSRKNVMPILIPDLPENALHIFLDELDGFLFQGGVDMAPKTYNAKPIDPDKWPGDHIRDVFELKVMEYAIKKDKPIMCICRGHQLLNVFFGGTLYQDIPSQTGTKVMHQHPEIYDNVNHKVELVPGTILDSIHAQDPCRLVNSIHHQAVKDLGKDLEILATSPEDGIVEAIHWTGTKPGKVMGMQWHPEYFTSSTTPLISKDIVYDHFLSFC